MNKKATHSQRLSAKSSSYASTIEEENLISISLICEGVFPAPGDYTFYTLFNGEVLLDAKWSDKLKLEAEMALSLKDPFVQTIVADRPLVFLLRSITAKAGKEQDPLLHPENRAGATVDLFPLVLGEEMIHLTVPLLNIETGAPTGCKVEVKVLSTFTPDIQNVPLILIMISGHCMPQPPKEGTVYIAAVGLHGLSDVPAINFGMSLSVGSATKVVWATASTGGLAANTAFNVPNDDVFISPDLEPLDTPHCQSVYWNAMKRVLVDPSLLRERLASPFLIEVAGIPKLGKIDVRGRYMGYVDAGVLLEPGQLGVTTSAKLWYFSETNLPEDCKPLLELPPVSAKVASARESDSITDEHGHSAYVVIRFDLPDPLTPKQKMAKIFKTLGIVPPDGIIVPCNELELDPLPEDDTHVDVRKIRKDCGALAVHKELGALACRGAVPMGQSIKRTAANRLLMRVRTMLKSFPPEDGISYIEWQDTVTGQHAATRRAVTASFAPQAPPLRAPYLVAASRCRLAGDHRIAACHVKMHLAAKPGSPSALLSKALECLVERNDSRARDYYLEALRAHPKNRYLLWMYGAQDFDKDEPARDAAFAALRIAVKGDYSDGTSNAIGWAAMHAFNHFNKNDYTAFIAAKKMRKSYELPQEWKKFYESWIQTSGEEEIFWIPTVISTCNPLVVAATFFLCLRCYAFVERLLYCAEEGCFTKGARRKLVGKTKFDVYYVRAASYLLRGRYEEAFEMTNKGINKYGPSAIMAQMQTSCLVCIHGWNETCKSAFLKAEVAGATQCPAILLRAALAGFKIDPMSAMQWAARSHQISPSAHSALLIGRIYRKMGEYKFAERWAAAAVKLEPLLADGWAILGILALYERDPEKARTMIRTANQAGPISKDIKQKLDKLSEKIKMEALPDTLVADMCHHDKPYVLGDREPFAAEHEHLSSYFKI